MSFPPLGGIYNGVRFLGSDSFTPAELHGRVHPVTSTPGYVPSREAQQVRENLDQLKAEKEAREKAAKDNSAYTTAEEIDDLYAYTPQRPALPTGVPEVDLCVEEVD